MASMASMASTALRERARGALLGLAVGDALGAPAENLKPSEIRARWGRITGYVAEVPAGTDDTEYAIFSGLLLARHGSGLTPAHVEAAWHEFIADREEGPFRGAGFSERGTLENLRRGLAAPISAQHRHAWSDGLAMRAAPHGVFAAGRPAEAARLAAVDGSVSHDGEGIYGGQAVAAGVAAAMAGAVPDVVVASALAVVPEDSWTARCLRRAMTAAHRGERAVRSAVVIGGYPWTDLAPEAVALAFGAYAAADGDFRQAVLTAVNMGRDADTTAAVAGALSGATHGAAAIPPEWSSAIGPARGSCLPAMAGQHVREVADLLVAAAERERGRGGAGGGAVGGAGRDAGSGAVGGAGRCTLRSEADATRTARGTRTSEADGARTGRGTRTSEADGARARLNARDGGRAQAVGTAPATSDRAADGRSTAPRTPTTEADGTSTAPHARTTEADGTATAPPTQDAEPDGARPGGRDGVQVGATAAAPGARDGAPYLIVPAPDGEPAVEAGS
ncbi:ADP-ribosylglycohydrolase family protein [Streptomyces sp. NPDC003717]|uniref:ADP-ribosylglycohydrolase family protein n=1 Tax=Streptomyces sp. NPDC003717 TaxID=3154276 RepID=UPI0033ADECB5